MIEDYQKCNIRNGLSFYTPNLYFNPSIDNSDSSMIVIKHSPRINTAILFDGYGIEHKENTIEICETTDNKRNTLKRIILELDNREDVLNTVIELVPILQRVKRSCIE